MSTLFEMNSDKKLKQLVNKKRRAGDSYTQEVPIPCLWGNLFEPIIREYVAVVLETQIFGHDICIVDGQFRYSPDGLGIITHENGCMEIVLFEFKCPYSRIPQGDVPKQYEPQLWAGLAATGIAKCGLYVDAVFRKCRESQLGNTLEYDKQYHWRDRSLYENPIAWGLINVYSRDRDDNREYVDFGDANGEVFDQMLRDVGKGELVTSLVYLQFQNKNRKVGIIKMQNHDDVSLIGCIPFKIMRVCSKKVESVPNFKERIVSNIAAFFEKVNRN